MRVSDHGCLHRVVGTIVSFLLGVIICLNIESIRQFLSPLTNTELFSPELYFLSHLPADMDSGEISIVVMALQIAFATLPRSIRHGARHASIR
jgi:lipoprotein-releasing system permease protein